MQKYDRRTIAWARFGVPNVQNAGIDLLQWAERLVRPRFDRRHSCAVWSCWIVRAAEPIMPSSADAIVIIAVQESGDDRG